MSSISNVSSGSSYQPDFSTISQNLLNKADSDGDGYLNKTELTSVLKTNKRLSADLNSYYGTDSSSTDGVFSALDTDSDGLVSISELKTAVSNTKGGQAGGPPPPPPSDMEQDS